MYKGYWKHSRTNDYTIVDGDNREICKYAVSSDTEYQDWLNARLIINAPNM